MAIQQESKDFWSNIKAARPEGLSRKMWSSSTFGHTVRICVSSYLFDEPQTLSEYDDCEDSGR